jgi:DNA-binding LacI/PurR family transcriptional regulator
MHWFAGTMHGKVGGVRIMKEKPEVNAKKIAEITGVSPSTVSIVLNNKGGEFRIAEKTREKILLAADELGYHPVARVRRKRKKLGQETIFIFCPIYFDRGPTARFYIGFLRYFKEKNLNYDTILFPYESGKLEEKARWFSSESMSGAVLMALVKEDIDFIENNQFDIPIILYNRSAKGYCSVLTDDYSVGYKTMSHFIKRGHKSFGVVSPNYSSRALSFRMLGFWDRFQSYGFKTGEAYAAPVAFGDDSDTGGYQATQTLLQSRPVPSAIFIPSDNMVGGIVRSIHEHELRIPQDIELISYGNKPVNLVVTPNVSSFAMPVDEMSFHCARLLHNFIANGITTDNVKLSFEAECIFRESSPALP